MTASRSLSLTRNSAAPVTTVSPPAAAAAMKNTGNSSIASGTSASGTRMPAQRAGAHMDVRDRLRPLGRLPQTACTSMSRAHQPQHRRAVRCASD